MIKNKITIRKEFFILGLGSSLFISFVFIGIFSYNLYQSSLQDAQQKMLTSNLVITTKTENLLEHIAMTVDVLSHDILISDYMMRSVDEQTLAKAKFKAVTSTHPHVTYAYAGYVNGMLVINDYTHPTEYDLTQRPWYLSAIAAYPELSIGLPYQEIIDKEWLISVSKVLVNEAGKPTGVVAIDSSLGDINTMMNEARYYDSQANFVVNSQGEILVHPDHSFMGKYIEELSPGSMQLLAGPSGFISYDLPTEERLAYFKRIEQVDWIIISAIDSDEILLPIRHKVINVTLILLLLSITLGLFIVKLYDNRFVKPLNLLKTRIKRITSGETALHPYTHFSNFEIEEISQNIEKMATTSLSKKAYELNLILESTSDGILVLGTDKTIIHFNQRFLDIWELDKETHYKTYADFSKPIIEDINQFYMMNNNVTDIIHFDNGRIYERFSCPVMDEDTITGRLLSYRDVTDKMQVEEQLRLYATTDGLTTLWNRRYFMERADFEFKQALRFGLELALIQMDIDFFKNINDTYGHATGDVDLRYVASSLKSLLRETDLIGRIGGEEFAILVVATEPLMVKALSEKIRHHFETHTFSAHQNILSFTVSLGIAFNTPETKDLDELLEVADAACYKAKSLGRNQTYCIIPTEREAT